MDANDHSYFLSFNPSEGRWYVFAPSFGQMHPVRVINDVDAAVTNDDLFSIDGGDQAIIN